MTYSFELMHSYPEFSEDVAQSFQYLIKKHSLKVTAQGIYSVNIDSKYCRLNFNMDRYDLQGLLYSRKGFIIKKLSSPYGIIASAIAMCPDKDILSTFPKTSYGNNESIRKLLDWHVELIETCLEDVFKPDFDWKRIAGC